MVRPRALAALALIAPSFAACTTTTTVVTPLTPLRESVLLPSPDGYAPLAATFAQSGRHIDGRLAWSQTCERALVPRARSVETRTREPMQGAAAAAGFGAVALGAAGSGVLAHLDFFSDEESCSVDSDGDETCSSPRDDATLVGIVLATSAVALAATSIATFATKRSTTNGDEKLGPAGRPLVVENGVDCGHGVPSDLGLALEQDGRRVSASRTDEHGDVRFSLPDGASGTVDVVLDDEPPGEPVVHRGDLVGRLELSAAPSSLPVAPPLPEAPAAGNPAP